MNRQLTVLGYIRQYEKVNKIHIPQGIVLVFILFYGNDSDEWDPKFISYTMKLTDRTVTQTLDAEGSSYCKRIIESGIFKWKFKIDQCKGGFILGIWKIKNNTTTPPLKVWFTKNETPFSQRHKPESAAVYGFHSKTSCLTRNDGWALGPEYGIYPANDSIIEMILDLNKLTLSYIIDGKDYGKAFDVEKSKYRAAVFFYTKGDAITLLKD